LPAALFGLVVRTRGALYDHGMLPVGRLEVPVVSVGNLCTGGSGKTPMVRWIAEHLRERGRVPGVLSRGYRARAGERSDEARELLLDWPELLHVENPDRCAGGTELVERGADVVVLDDGFQHRALHRDVDVVLVDATRPWGLGAPSRGGEPVCALLPRGLLREPPAALERADCIVITRCEQAPVALLDRLEEELERLAPGKPIARATHAPLRLRSLAGLARDLAFLRGRDVVLLSGIGNPGAFERTVEGLGARVERHLARPDHHVWTPADLAGLGSAATLLTTAKDSVKLAGLLPEALVLEVRMEVQSGSAVLEALLDALPPSPASHARAGLHAGLHG
jgi:tetraacyldisaccharide 4'-kinase